MLRKQFLELLFFVYKNIDERRSNEQGKMVIERKKEERKEN